MNQLMKSVLFLGCPVPERAETERALSTAGLSVVWADSPQIALGELIPIRLGRRVLIERKSIDDYIDRHRVGDEAA